VSKKKKTSEWNSGTAVVIEGTTEKKSSRRNTAGSKAGSVTRKKSATPKKISAPRFEPSDDEIRMRAYFISERRKRLGLAGDSNSDWLEAKRQLFSEHGPR
jgi:hypothetical protein